VLAVLEAGLGLSSPKVLLGLLSLLCTAVCFGCACLFVSRWVRTCGRRSAAGAETTRDGIHVDEVAACDVVAAGLFDWRHHLAWCRLASAPIGLVRVLCSLEGSGHSVS